MVAKNKLLIIILSTVIGIGLLIFIGILIWFPISPLNTFVNLLYQKEISGSVYDCDDSTPVVDAVLTLSGTGWGWRDGPVWDQSYLSSTRSDLQGSFNLKYNLGTELSVQKEGYLKAIKYVIPKTQVKIGLVKKTSANKDELSSYDCKLFSECFKTKEINGVSTSWDSCSNPELDKEFE